MTPAALDLLALDAETSFVLSGAGRILRENDPHRSPGPRLALLGCAEGRVLHLRHDVRDATAASILARLGQDPPWFDPWEPPGGLDEVLDLLSREAPVAGVGPGLVYRLPHDLPQDPGQDDGVRMVCGDTVEGRAWLEDLAARGLPQALLTAGFLGVGDFWDPWCVALVEGEVAATAFAARLGARGAEAGVYTFPGFRGRGFAAAVTARWSSLPSLATRTLFYSTQRENLSSQKVAARLGLARIGASLRIT
jgi:hypothetical protein